MTKKNQNKCYCAHVVTLVIVFRNIYQIYRPITLLEHMLMTNKYVANNYGLINGVINTSATLLWNISILRVFNA